MPTATPSAAIRGVQTNAYATKGGTVSSTAVAIADLAEWGANDLATAVRAFVSAIGAGVVVTWSGETPTATLGHPIPDGGTIEVLGGENINNLKFIRDDVTDAEVNVTLEK